MRRTANKIFKGRQLTIGMDLGDRSSFYCVLDESGRVLLEDKLATTPEAMKQTFARILRSRIAMETGTHSPWISRLLTQLGHEVIVAHAQKVDLITKSTRKDDRHDAKNLARLARIDPELLGPVRHRSAQAQLAERGGKNAKKRAVVAVARKLAILLHRLWVSGEVYEPLRNSQKAISAAA
jgi:hypothetical protein